MKCFDLISDLFTIKKSDISKEQISIRVKIPSKIRIEKKISRLSYLCAPFTSINSLNSECLHLPRPKWITAQLIQARKWYGLPVRNVDTQVT